MNPKVKKTLRWMRRYISMWLIAAIVFVVYLLFFNDYSSVKASELSNQIENIKQQIKQERDSADFYLRLNRSLQTDPSTMEKVMREQYNYQRKGEDVYIFED